MMDYEPYLALAKDVAEQAAVIAKKHFKRGLASELKSNNTPVTIADTTINSMVIQEVKRAYPSHDVLGEEESDLSNGSDYVWVCDPIDGTNPYMYGLPYSCFMLALTYKGEPVAAVIHDIFSDRMYWATKGGGAFVNGEKINVNQETDIKRCVIASSSKISKSVDVPELRKNTEAVCHRLIILMCTSQESLLVATGQIAGGIFVSIGAHDVAAPMLIVTEAGGKATDIHGNDQRYDREVDGFVYSNGLIHQDLLDIAKRSLLKG